MPDLNRFAQPRIVPSPWLNVAGMPLEVNETGTSRCFFSMKHSKIDTTHHRVKLQEIHLFDPNYRTACSLPALTLFINEHLHKTLMAYTN